MGATSLASIGGLALLIGCGGGGGDGADAGVDAYVDAGPGAADIEFQTLADLPSGSWLLANDWAPDPNVAFALPISDLGATRRALFSVNRVWSMGAARDGSAIYFSAWDAEQEAHYGVTIGDAIQNTFVYYPATDAVRALAWGNINDECHQPTGDGTVLYVCRRYDFTAEGGFSGWRIGAITLADGSFEFLRADDPGGPFELSPQEIPGTRSILYEQRARPPATGAAIYRRDLDTGTEAMVRADAARPLLSPDGHTVLFQDRTDGSTYKTFDLDAPAAAPVVVTATAGAGSAAWSPDGATLIYTVYDSAQTCDHLEEVTFSGVWSAPARLRDCSQTGEFITEIAWVTVP